MPRLLLISPRFPNNFWNMTHSLKALGQSYPVAPCGLATIAALTPDSWQVRIVDENVEALDFDLPADIVGITAYSTQVARLREIALQFKKRGRMVVVGGPGTSVYLQHYLQSRAEHLHDICDVIFFGEAELTWPLFCADYLAAAWHPRYVQKERIAMTASPPPRYELVNLKRYGEVAVQTTRGCRFGCDFCDVVQLYGRVPRQKPASQVLAEVQAAYRQGAQRIFIADDNFIADIKYAEHVLAQLYQFQCTIGHALRFGTQCTINVAEQAALLASMRKTGFSYVFIGLESPSKEALMGTSKQVNAARDMVKAVHTILAHGIAVMAGMIVGFDQDTVDIFERHYQFLQAACIPIVMEGVLIAPYGTPLAKRLASEGRLHEFEADILKDNNFAKGTNFEPAGMRMDELVHGHRQLLQRLYAVDNFWQRVQGAVTHMRAFPKFGGFSLREWRQGARIFWYCLRRPSYRALAWRCLKLLLSTPRAAHSIVLALVVYVHMQQFSFHHFTSDAPSPAPRALDCSHESK